MFVTTDSASMQLTKERMSYADIFPKMILNKNLYSNTLESMLPFYPENYDLMYS